MKKKINYKLTTIALLAFIFIAGTVFLVNSYIDNKLKESYIEGVVFGQENAVNIILSQVVEEGNVVINTPQGNVTLVPYAFIDLSKEELIKTIIDIAKEDGEVKLSGQDSSITLTLKN